MLLIARTDSESGKLISSNIDIKDHEFMLGTTQKNSKPLAQLISEAEARGATGAEIDALEKQWIQAHPMCTFNQGGPTLQLLLLLESNSHKLTQLSRKPFPNQTFKTRQAHSGHL